MIVFGGEDKRFHNTEPSKSIENIQVIMKKAEIYANNL